MLIHGVEATLYNMYPHDKFRVSLHADEYDMGWVLWVSFDVKGYRHKETMKFYTYEADNNMVLLPEAFKAKLMLLLG